MSNALTPDIRFKGFADDWEQRKLDKVAQYRNGKAHEDSISDKGKYILFQQMVRLLSFQQFKMNRYL